MRFKPTVVGGVFVYFQCLPDVDSELMLTQACGDVRVSLGKDVGIDAQGEARLAPDPSCAACQQFQLRLAFNVEFEDICLERKVDLSSCLADSRKNYLVCSLRCGSQHPLQLAPGDDVEAGAMTR